MMDERERSSLAQLPDTVDIFRGCHDWNKEGFSWTRDLEMAQSFAHRNREAGQKEPIVVLGTVQKSSIIAFLDRRNESEIIVDPKKVTVIEEVVGLGRVVLMRYR